MKNNENRLSGMNGAFAFAGLFAAAFALRMATTAGQPLWTDEALALDFAKADWAGLLYRLKFDASPPGSYLIFKIWGLFFDSILAFRMLTALFGAATVGGIFLIGSRLFGKGAALAAATFLLLNPYHIYYSQDIRYPAILTAFGVFQVLFFLRCMDSEKAGDAIAWAALTVFALWTQYFFIFLLFTEILWVAFAMRGSRKMLRRFRICLGAVALFAAPLIPIFSEQWARGKPDREIIPFFSMLFQSVAFPVLGGSEMSLPRIPIFEITPSAGAGYVVVAFALCMPFLAAFISGAFHVYRDRRWILILLLTILPAILFFQLSRFVPLFRPKYLLPLLPFALLLVAKGIWQENRRVKFCVALTLSFAAFTGMMTINQAFDPLCRRVGWDKIGGAIQSQEQKGDVILIPNAYHSLAFPSNYHGALSMFSYASETIEEVRASEKSIEETIAKIAGARRVWLVDHKANIFDLDELMNKYADENWTLIDTFDGLDIFGYVKLRLYAIPESAEDELKSEESVALIPMAYFRRRPA